MKKLFVVALAALALTLTGCASTNYADYRKIHEAYAKAQEVAYTSMAAVGVSGDDTAKVASMFAIMGMKAGNQSQANIAPPRSASDTALAWAGVLVPGFTQGYTVYSGTKLGIEQSRNATALGISSDNTMLGIAGQIQAPAANVTLSGSGVIGDGTYTKIDGSYNPAPIADSYNPVDNSQQPVDNSVVNQAAP